MEPLLKSLSIRKASELSRKARHLYRRALFFKRKSIAQRKKTQCFHSELAKAVKYSQRRSFHKLTSGLHEVARIFFYSQIKCLPKKPKGRRFTIEDKITALALYKQSGAGYKFLRQIFALPSRITIMRLLNSVPIEAGINQCVFDGLKEIQKNLKPLERYCFILFDEMSLTANLSYYRGKDEVYGFEDFGDYKTDKIADHVQVRHEHI